MALLLLRRHHRIGREELVEILFADLAPHRAANAVAKALSMARSALAREDGGQVLMSDRNSIWINPEADLWIDLHEHLEALRPGPDKTDAATGGASFAAALRDDRSLLADEPYVEWALADRDRLATARLEARLSLARAMASAAVRPDERRVVEAWTDVIARDPTSEEACAGLMRAHAAGRRRDRAIRAYHRCRLALRDELDVEPSPALEHLYAAIIADDPPPEARPQARGQGRISHAAPALFGRDAQLRHLRRRLSETHAGRGPALVVLGPAGIGKTRLLEAVAHELETGGWFVLQGTAVPDDRLLPYAALRSALRPIFRSAPPASGSLLAALASESAPAEGSRPADLDGEAARAQLADELAELLRVASAERPVGLVIDDLQWADPALQGLLLRLSCSAGARSWALVLGSRSGERQASMPALHPTTERVELAPLSERATRRTVRHALGGRRLPASTMSEIVRRSQGNPFFVVELARHATTPSASAGVDPPESGLPTAIAELLRSKLDGCSPVARRLLPLVAMAGAEARYEVLLRIGADAGLAGSTEAAVRALENLLDIQLLEEHADGLRLAHPLLRDAALIGVNALRRAAIHTRIADALEALVADGDERWRDAAARHRLAAFQAGGLRETAKAAARAALEAGTRARLLFADEAAAELFRGGLAAFEAMSADEREDLRPLAVSAAIQLGEAIQDAEGDAAAEAAFRRGLKLSANDHERALAWSAIGGIAYRHGDMERAIAAYEQGLNSLGDVASSGAARLRTDLGWSYFRTGRPDDALALVDQVASSIDLEADPGFGGLVLDRLAMALSSLDRLEEAIATIDRALEVSSLPGGERVRPTVLVHRGMLVQRNGRLHEALVDLRAAQRMFAAGRERYAQSVAHWAASDLLAEMGDLDDALAERDAEVGLLLQIDNVPHLAMSQAGRSRLLHALGRHDEGRTAAQAARVAAERSGNPRILARIESELVSQQGGRE